MPTEGEPHRSAPQEKGHLGMAHGMSAQERGRKGAEARWGKTHEGDPEEGYGNGRTGHGEIQRIPSSQRTGKLVTRGMSPHDRGVRGARARWSKAHQVGSTSPAEQHPTEARSQKGG